jgi:hypothetical protein
MQQNALLKLLKLLNDEIKSWHQSMRPLEKIYTNLEGKKLLSINIVKFRRK